MGKRVPKILTTYTYPFKYSELFNQCEVRAKEAKEKGLPVEIYLSDAFPNPFSSAPRVGFGLPDDGHIPLKAYDLSGLLVNTLFEGFSKAVDHSIIFNMPGSTTGLYIVQLEAGSQSIAKLMMLIK